MKIKICGLCDPGDALFAWEAGADYLGFIFADSPRKLSQSGAEEVIKGLPEEAVKVGVFVDECLSVVKMFAEELALDYIQLHGNENSEYCENIYMRLNQGNKKTGIIKSFRIKGVEDLEGLENYNDKFVDYFLLDTWVKGKAGGTGERFDWNILNMDFKIKKPVFLAGGINTGNISDAVSVNGVYALDVSSGIEISPGKKDRDKIKEVIDNAHEIKELQIQG